MPNKNNNNNQYIEGNSRVRLAIFVFLGLWILTGFLLKPIAEKRIEQINAMTQSNPDQVVNEVKGLLIKFRIIPQSIFISIQGLYFLWLGIKTMRAGIYPPPDVRMPFRTRIQNGRKAKLTAIGCIIASLCHFAVIAFLILYTEFVWNDILKHI